MKVTGFNDSIVGPIQIENQALKMLFDVYCWFICTLNLTLIMILKTVCYNFSVIQIWEINHTTFLRYKNVTN